jgi:hypothetical protein
MNSTSRQPQPSDVLPFARTAGTAPGQDRLLTLVGELDDICHRIDGLLDAMDRSGLFAPDEARRALDELREAVLPHVARTDPARLDRMLADLGADRLGGVA